MPIARIESVASYLPTMSLSNDELERVSGTWQANQIYAKTGIRSRRISAANEYSSKLAIEACDAMFAKHSTQLRDQIDLLILCTQTPDYLLPTTACIVHHKLGLNPCAGALDVNLGCSGYPYCLSLAKGMIESGQALKVLVVTADTYSKTLEPDDLSVRTLFGDGATATLIESCDDSVVSKIGTSVFGTDGSGSEHLIVKGGGMRFESNKRPTLFMSGPDVFSFTLKAVPNLVKQTLEKSNLEISDIDWFVFHQANQYMLEHLRRKIKIPTEKFVVEMENVGNTVSSSIPLAMEQSIEKNRFQTGDKIMLVGFGVGLSWGATVVTW